MKKLFQKIGNVLEYVWNVLGCILFFAIILGCLFVFGKVLQDLSPIITFGFLAIGTLFACTNSRLNKILCLSGLAIYIASFVAVGPFSTIVAMLICLVGLLMWFQSAISAFGHHIGGSPARC